VQPTHPGTKTNQPPHHHQYQKSKEKIGRCLIEARTADLPTFMDAPIAVVATTAIVRHSQKTQDKQT